jgi:hypothetical protein
MAVGSKQKSRSETELAIVGSPEGLLWQRDQNGVLPTFKGRFR